MKDFSCFRSFYPVNRLVYHALEQGHEAERHVEKKGEEKKSPYEDRATREDVYRRAEEKGKAFLASDDPKKQERGERLLKDVKAARESEGKLDVSMALTIAQGLDRGLRRIASREKTMTQAAADKLKGDLAKEEEAMRARLAGEKPKVQGGPPAQESPAMSDAAAEKVAKELTEEELKMAKALGVAPKEQKAGGQAPTPQKPPEEKEEGPSV